MAQEFLVTQRTDYKGRMLIVVMFDDKPPAQVRQVLRNMNFHWSDFVGFWYRTQTDEITLDVVKENITQAYNT